MSFDEDDDARSDLEFIARIIGGLALQGTDIMMVWLYFKMFNDGNRSDSNRSILWLARKILTIFVILPANIFLERLFEIFMEVIFHGGDFDCTYTELILGNLRFIILPNLLIIICLGLAAVLVWYGMESVKIRALSETTKMNFTGMTLVLLVAIKMFVMNSLKPTLGEAADTSCNGMFGSNYVENFQIGVIGTDLSGVIAILCYTFFIGKIYYEPQSRNEFLTPKATSVYHDLDGSLIKLITILFAQLFLFAIYSSNTDYSGDRDKSDIDTMFSLGLYL
mmetsp:Transcript_24494/g.36329  ORF Transcript_24494/g.36329 Transcript_24494/m.36329 type:complete len:279 (-) Transcript_24494:689-1525(-)